MCSNNVKVDPFLNVKFEDSETIKQEPKESGDRNEYEMPRDSGIVNQDLKKQFNVVVKENIALKMKLKRMESAMQIMEKGYRRKFKQIHFHCKADFNIMTYWLHRYETERKIASGNNHVIQWLDTKWTTLGALENLADGIESVSIGFFC